MNMEVEDIVGIYRKRWVIELLFKQLKQNFPLRYFYGESANAIKIQIWVTLIANLLLMVMQRRIKRSWSFSNLATMFRIMLMYYVNCYTFFEHPERDWLNPSLIFNCPFLLLSSTLRFSFVALCTTNFSRF